MDYPKRKPRVGITMGCPASIGPELIVKYFSSDNQVLSQTEAIVIGDIGILNKCCQEMNSSFQPVAWKNNQPISPGTIPVIEVSSLNASDHCWGIPNIATGKAMALYITEGVRLIQEGTLNGITTCPIAKTSLNEAGYHFPGHTEMLASLTGSTNYGMMMAGSRLKVTLATIHCAFEKVPRLLSTKKIFDTIKMTWQCLQQDFGIASPKLAVAALNPHGGESGIFGDQESSIIHPAVQQGQNEGMNISGPFPLILSSINVLEVILMA